jgi:hypothetical protein
MKKLNLKDKLNLSKTAVSKFELDQISGGATIAGCGISKKCGTSFGLPCITICGLSIKNCAPSSPTVC